ncbi:hypothetical protein ACFL27_24920 [candidate division CSSED10-310 bacterium]|uniref:Uncharacterized protein n=1 Tax=candidate division CSSED10-310 bacterium TaxID=2855610 RepID=A0ABV6Z546_UNCC1
MKVGKDLFIRHHFCIKMSAYRPNDFRNPIPNEFAVNIRTLLSTQRTAESDCN